jgi:hypothetical protein
MYRETDVIGRASLLDRFVARAPAYLRFVRDRPAWLVMFLFGRTLIGRRAERLIHRAGYAEPAPVVGPTLFENVDLARCVKSLIEDGIATGLNLPARVVDDINAFAATHYCYARDRQDRGFLLDDLAA